MTAPNPVLSTLKYFKNEYIEHIVNKRCPAGVCNIDAHATDDSPVHVPLPTVPMEALA
jgi:hypothetical protein